MAGTRLKLDPADGGFPESIRRRRLTLIGYGRGAIVRAFERVENGDPIPVVERLLVRPDVEYVHVRDADAGCYDFRIEAGSHAM